METPTKNYFELFLNHEDCVSSLIDYRALLETDVQAYQALRLAALLDMPMAFGGTFDEEKDYPLEAYRALLKDGLFQGAWIEGGLIGVGALRLMRAQKMRHRGEIFGMYIKSEWRGRGVAHILMEHLIGIARLNQVDQVELHVTELNVQGQRFYEKEGFIKIGTIPRAQKFENQYLNEHIFVKPLS